MVGMDKANCCGLFSDESCVVLFSSRGSGSTIEGGLLSFLTPLDFLLLPALLMLTGALVISRSASMSSVSLFSSSSEDSSSESDDSDSPSSVAAAAARPLWLHSSSDESTWFAAGRSERVRCDEAV